MNRYMVHSMYVDTTTSRRGNKVYTRHLLRSSYRENGKVKHRTLLNLSSMCTDEEIAAIKLALKHKGNLASLSSLGDIETTLGKSIGAVWAVHVIAKRIGIATALGSSNDAKLGLLQVIARIIDQGSRLSAVRFAVRHAVCEILGIKKLDEDDLYANLSWLAAHQEEIEKKLFASRYSNAPPTLFLYDVTSSYLEGNCNELASWGYNRDKKSGKKQIVIGLLAGSDGLPIAVRVFEGNTTDPKTVSEQIRILSKSFGVKNVTLVGDRGMLKGPEIDALPDDFRYITAITKPQIQKMLNEGTFQYELFSDHVCAVEVDTIRYILRRNPMRAQQMEMSRNDKLVSIESFAREKTRYLAEHPRAHVRTALAKVSAKIDKLKIREWLKATEDNRVICIEKDEAALSKAALLDGCYVIKSDIPKSDADTQNVHDRYCDLELVERAFRTMKSTHLELRPVFVTKKASTQGHVFVVMLALLIQRELERCWAGIDATVQECIEELGGIHLQEIKLDNTSVQNIPKPTKLGRQLLDMAKVTMPAMLPTISVNVHTKKNLPSERNKL